jgi:hypothetical protein
LQIWWKVEIRLLVGEGQWLEIVERLEIVHCFEMFPDLVACDFTLQFLAEAVNDADHEKVLKYQNIRLSLSSTDSRQNVFMFKCSNSNQLTLFIPTGRKPCSARNS